MPTFRVATLSEVASSLPSGHVLARRLQELAGVQRGEWVACFSGNLRLPALDLAAPLAAGSPLHALVPAGQTLPPLPCRVFIDGDLHIDGALTGGAPQGATHLIVAGNLQAHDATVDGLLDIGGALAVTDLLWGHGAQGALCVHGGLSARVGLFTHGFQLQLQGPEHIAWLLDEVRGVPHLAEFSREAVTALFLPPGLAGSDAPLSAGEDGITPLLNRDAIVTALRHGQCVLPADEAIAAAWPLATALFADETISVANVLTAVHCVAVARKQHQASGWFGQTDFSLCQRHVDEDGDPRDASVFMTVWKTWDFYVAVERVPVHRGALARLGAALRRQPAPFTEQLLLAYRSYRHGTPAQWQPLDEIAHPEAWRACTHAWRGVLDYLRKADGQARAGYPLWRRLQAELTPARIKAFTSLPRFTEHCTDWWDSDRNGWWEDDIWVGARQPCMHGGQPWGRAFKLSWKNGVPHPAMMQTTPTAPTSATWTKRVKAPPCCNGALPSGKARRARPCHAAPPTILHACCACTAWSNPACRRQALQQLRQNPRDRSDSPFCDVPFHRVVPSRDPSRRIYGQRTNAQQQDGEKAEKRHFAPQGRSRL